MTNESSSSARLDQWLWAVRLFKTRTLAATACRAGHVKINGQNVKPAHQVRPGEIIQARVAEINRTVKVIASCQRRMSAKLVPQFMEDQTPPEEFEKTRDPYFPRTSLRPPGAGRPTKKERRDLSRLSGLIDPPPG